MGLGLGGFDPFAAAVDASRAFRSFVRAIPSEIVLKAWFENGWRPSSVARSLATGARACLLRRVDGRPARPGRRPADRNCRGQPSEKAVPIGSNCRSRSVRRVAGRQRRVACAASKPFSKHALSRNSSPAATPSIPQARCEAGFGEGPQKSSVVSVVLENWLATVTPVHHMPNGTWIFDSESASHDGNLSSGHNWSIPKL